MILLLLLPFSAITENYGRFFEGISNGICQSPYSCSFLITTNYPTSPKIPTRLPTQAILGSYKYIYLLFGIPKKQKQKQFFLEAYDISNGETIITNGDCYFINTTNNTDYEIRIYKPLKYKSFIQFGFLGLTENFSMIVNIRFKFSTYLYVYDIALSYNNAVYKGNEESLKNYIEKNNKAIVKQKERRDMAKKIIKIIMKKLFMTDIDYNLFNDELYCSGTIYISPFVKVTVSYAAGLELSTEVFFEPEENIISESKFINGKVKIDFGGLDLFDGNANVNNPLIKILDFYENFVTNLMIQVGIETDYFTLTVSTNLMFIKFNFRFYFENTTTVFFEIEVKLELYNPLISSKVINKVKTFFEDHPIVVGIIILVIIGIILGPEIAAAWEIISAGLESIAVLKSLSSFIPIIPIFAFNSIDTDKKYLI